MKENFGVLLAAGHNPAAPVVLNIENNKEPESCSNSHYV